MSKKSALVAAGIVVVITIAIFFYFEILDFKVEKQWNELDEMQVNQISEAENSSMIKYTKSFGNYEVPSTWEENKEYSTVKKFFYIAKDEMNMKTPDNISINVGTNKYTTSEHEKFRKAILAQLTYQVAGSGATINANGSTTENGYIVYEFNIEEKDAITTQYYIVGDYKYVLIHETVFDDKEGTDAVARNMVNTFKWSE